MGRLLRLFLRDMGLDFDSTCLLFLPLMIEFIEVEVKYYLLMYNEWVLVEN